MKLWVLLLFLVSTNLFAQNAAQQPPNKEALLIANGDYAHFGKLPNPVNDARLLAQSLQKIGFRVTLLEDQSREGMLDALNAFQDRLKSNHGLAFFHYGGHGVQVNGKNFLIPVDADIPDERKVSTRAVDLEEVMTTLDASGSTVNVVVLDACRDNPLPATASRSATRGLSVVQTKPKNSLIVYAAEPGSKAEDGLFTPTLAESITSPGKSLSQIFKDVRRQVFQKSNGNQTPGEYDQLFEDVYLTGGGSTSPLPMQEFAQQKPMSLSTSGQQSLQTDPESSTRIASPKKTSSALSAITSDAQRGAWLFFDSSQRLLSESELSTLSQDDLWRARNEIFARHGYIFKTSKGQTLAASLGSLYSPVSSSQDQILSMMNPVERSNIEMIQRLEKTR